jgi:hypothetical protein
LLTREEKKRRVIELLEEGRSTRYIAKEIHISFLDIGLIKKEHFGETEAQTKSEEELTIDTKVFKLFEEGKGPVQLAIDLNLPSREVTRLQREYWRLKGLQVLDDLYEDIKDEVFQFHRTYELTKGEGYTPRQLIEVANHLGELPLLRSENEKRVEENQNLEKEKWSKTIELERINENVAIAKQNLDTIKAGVQKNTEELERLNGQKFQVQAIIASLNTSAGYQQIHRIAESSARNVLNQNQVILTAACRAHKPLRYYRLIRYHSSVSI